MKFLNELAASNDRNFKFTALVARPFGLCAASHHGAAGRADESLPLDHAGGDAIDIRNTVAAESLGIALAGGPLLHGALGSGRNG